MTILDEGRNKSPYHGFWAIIFAMFFVTSLINFVVFTTVLRFGGRNAELNMATSKLIGCGHSILFYLILFISGIFNHSMHIVFQRICEFFQNLSISFSFALKNYFWDMKHNGVAFLIYFLVMAVVTLVFVDGLLDVLQILKL